MIGHIESYLLCTAGLSFLRSSEKGFCAVKPVQSGYEPKLVTAVLVMAMVGSSPTAASLPPRHPVPENDAGEGERELNGDVGQPISGQEGQRVEERGRLRSRDRETGRLMMEKFGAPASWADQPKVASSTGGELQVKHLRASCLMKEVATYTFWRESLKERW